MNCTPPQKNKLFSSTGEPGRGEGGRGGGEGAKMTKVGMGVGWEDTLEHHTTPTDNSAHTGDRWRRGALLNRAECLNWRLISTFRALNGGAKVKSINER